MRCMDCGKQDKLFEYEDGRRTLHLCAMCKAEREWRSESEIIVVPPPEKISFWKRLKKLFGLK